MTAYRVYCLNSAGRIDLVEWIDADGDSEALVQAQALKNGAIRCEIWEARRLVAVFGENAGGIEPAAPRSGSSAPEQGFVASGNIG